jgi:predicted alpha/beta superfamily hydrolase
MGGLVALFAGLTRPDVFGRIMSMSTATWFAEGGGAWLSDNRLLRLIEERPPPRDLRVYLQVGTEERSREAEPDVLDAAGRRLTYPRAYLEGSRAVAAALVARGLPAAHLRHVEDEGAPHNESAWARRFGDAVRWLYE